MSAPPLRLALLPLGIAVGVAVERSFHDAAVGRALTVVDFAVGSTLLAGGTVAWARRPEGRVGPLLVLSGWTWFLGNVAEPLVYVHRGPLVHVLLSYPSGRVRSRLVRSVIAAAYVDAAIEPLARSDAVTLALSAAVALTAARAFAATSGPARKAGGPALAAASAFAGVLALGAIERLTTSDAHSDAVLWAYDVVVVCIAFVLPADLLRSRWSDAAVTGLVVELGGARGGTLRDKLARALGDPSLEIGYLLPGTERYVDDRGRPLELPQPESRRTVTPLDRIAVLVHDEALLADRPLVDAVAAAARMAVANAGLQAEARAKAAELEASRRRIVEAADAQRRRIERELRAGVGRRLERAAALLAGAEPLAATAAELTEARLELEEFARGVHPGALTDGGLMPALSSLAERSGVAVELDATIARLPAPVEAALYFVCSEALANATKHAAARRITIEARADEWRARVAVADDGVGGADPAAGSGLRGLADRVEALGGSLRVASPAGAGTRVEAEIPLS